MVLPVMQNFTVNPCGAVHITMGDGGNIEGLSKFFLLANTQSCWHCTIKVLLGNCARLTSQLMAMMA